MQFINDQLAVLEKAIQNYLIRNKEPVLRRILATDGLDISASPNKDINLNTSGTGKAYYNGIELGTGGGGGDGNYLWLSGGNNIMLQDLSMGGNKSIVSMITGRNWDYVTADEALCKSDITGGFMTKPQSPQNIWDFYYGLILPRGLDASKSATPVEGAIYWATDTDKLYIGKGNNLWQEISGGGGPVWNVDLTISKDFPRLYFNDTSPSGYGGITFRRSGNAKATVELDPSDNLELFAINDMEFKVPVGQKFKFVVG
ncbi:MAG: hypothetical protein SCH70_07775 [Candidatus Methanoperedens sp.]|nr:hypothetical protein [Candidatus Methanoperedens sp.]